MSSGRRQKEGADLAKEGFEKALANMRELAEITTQSQKEAFDVPARGSKRTWKASEILEKSWQMNCIPDRCQDPLVAPSRLPEQRALVINGSLQSPP
jgi:hypothetical protein